MAKLKAAAIKNLAPGWHGDGDGVALRVAPGGSRQFYFRKMVHGKRKDFPLGPWPTLTLAQARIKAGELRLAILNGENPLAEKEAEKKKAATPTFREAAEQTFAAISPRWKSAKVAENWRQRLERHAMKHLADLPVDEIGREDVLRVLTPIWGVKIETARKVRRYIKQVFAWSQASGFIEHNVAGEMIDGALPSMPSVRANYRALPFSEVGEALEIVRASRASVSARLCLEFVVLTACRSGEARFSEWGEIDLDSRTWRIPASRTKNGREHRQPLSEQAVAVLEKARALHDGELIFPSPLHRGRELSPMTLTKLLRDCGLASRCVVHGFRSSFRSWSSEKTSADYAKAELCLGHAVGSAVERSYRRSDLYEKRARLLQSWANYITEAEPAKIVQLHSS